MIIDTFMFYNELDMLEFRLKELNSVVDKFILVESTKTFVGNNKPLYFEENKLLFKKYLHKIHHVVLSSNPIGNAWARETHQRIATGQALKYLNLNDDDIIIAGDVDEIPDANELIKFKNNGLPFPLLTLDKYSPAINNEVFPAISLILLTIGSLFCLSFINSKPKAVIFF